MDNLALGVIEWIGAITALLGSYFMATIKDMSSIKNHSFWVKFRPTLAYTGWIVSNLFCIYLFTVKSSYGLLVMNIGGLIVNIIGIYQWKTTNPSPLFSRWLFYVSALLLVCSLFFLTNYFIDESLTNIEWFGSLLGLVAAFLLASKTDKSYICWFIWCVSNLTLFILTFYMGYYGISFLQLGFMIINLVGCYRWVKMLKNNSFNALTHADLTSDISVTE